MRVGIGHFSKRKQPTQNAKAEKKKSLGGDYPVPTGGYLGQISEKKKKKPKPIGAKKVNREGTYSFHPLSSTCDNRSLLYVYQIVSVTSLKWYAKERYTVGI